MRPQTELKLAQSRLDLLEAMNEAWYVAKIC